MIGLTYDGKPVHLTRLSDSPEILPATSEVLLWECLRADDGCMLEVPMDQIEMWSALVRNHRRARQGIANPYVGRESFCDEEAPYVRVEYNWRRGRKWHRMYGGTREGLTHLAAARSMGWRTIRADVLHFWFSPPGERPRDRSEFRAGS